MTQINPNNPTQNLAKAMFVNKNEASHSKQLSIVNIFTAVNQFTAIEADRFVSASYCFLFTDSKFKNVSSCLHDTKTHDLSEPTHDLSEPTHDTSEPTHDLSEPTLVLSEPTHVLSELTHDLSEPTHDLSGNNKCLFINNITQLTNKY